MTSAASEAAVLDEQKTHTDQKPAANGPTQIQDSGKDGAYMPPKTVVGRALGNDLHSDAHKALQAPKGGVGTALSDTPISTAPSSPQM